MGELSDALRKMMDECPLSAKPKWCIAPRPKLEVNSTLDLVHYEILRRSVIVCSECGGEDGNPHRLYCNTCGGDSAVLNGE